MRNGSCDWPKINLSFYYLVLKWVQFTWSNKIKINDQKFKFAEFEDLQLAKKLKLEYTQLC